MGSVCERLAVMSTEVVAIVLTGAGVLVGVWRMVESVRRDLHREIGVVRADIGGVRRDLTAQIAAVNGRIDNILLADRTAAREASS